MCVCCVRYNILRRTNGAVCGPWANEKMGRRKRRGGKKREQCHRQKSIQMLIARVLLFAHMQRERRSKSEPMQQNANSVNGRELWAERARDRERDKGERSEIDFVRLGAAVVVAVLAVVVQVIYLTSCNCRDSP